MSDNTNIFELYQENAEEQGVEQPGPGGSRVWRDSDNKYHRLNGPAIITRSGHKEWFFHGYLHREDGPAIEDANGHKEWCKMGLLHNTNGPAVEFSDNLKSWWVNGRNFRRINKWAEAALEYEGKKPTEEMIEQKIAQVMQQDLFD